ncbi:MAG: DUF4178 domain-containing protein [Bacteroidota bacterium]
MFHRTFECPSCGSQVDQKRPGSRTLVCSYCGQTSHLNADTLQSAGDKRLLIDYGSTLKIGMQSKWKGKAFLVLGKLRIDYEDGFWDEWYIQFLEDGSEAWIQEDDGSFTLFKEKMKVSQKLNLKSINVGEWQDVGLGTSEKVFITSKSKAQVNGGEGELPFRIIPGEPADFVEGILKGLVVSIEILPDEQILYVGQPFKIEEFYAV